VAVVSRPSEAHPLTGAPPEAVIQVPPAPTAPPKNSAVRWLISAALLASFCAAGAYFYFRGAAPPAYTTAKVDRGDINATVTTTGSLNAMITVQVGSQVSGNIIALYADFNTKVKKGQLVAEIDPAPFQAAVEQATATLNAARAAMLTAQSTLAKVQSDFATAQANVAAQQANLVKAKSAVELARLENERREVMVKTGSTSQEDADTSRANYEQALASVSAAQASVTATQSAAESAREAIDVANNQIAQTRAVVAQGEAVLAQAKLNLAHTRILAPVDGTVQSRNMDIGQTVAASFQAPVIFLVAQDLTKMQVDTNVDEADVGSIQQNQPASFTVDAYPGQVFRGRVAQIRKAPINVQNVVTYDVVIEVPNPDLKLFPGMTANVTVQTGHVSRVLRIPKAALRFRPRVKQAPVPPNTQQVYVVGDKGQPLAVPVKTGLSDANHVELISGNLVENQQLITGTVAKAGESTSAPARAGSSKKLGF